MDIKGAKLPKKGLLHWERPSSRNLLDN